MKQPKPPRRRLRPRTQLLREAWMQRTQPAVVTIAFAANHITSLGQARDEMERKA